MIDDSYMKLPVNKLRIFDSVYDESEKVQENVKSKNVQTTNNLLYVVWTLLLSTFSSGSFTLSPSCSIEE